MSKLVLKVIRLNIIIVSSNQSAQVYRLLRSVAALNRPAQMTLAVTVVDDGSTDKESARLEALKDKGIEVLCNRKPRGWIFSVNRACGTAKADWCWVLSAEAVIDDPHSLTYIDAMARHNPAMILGHSRYQSESPLARALNWHVQRPEKLEPLAAVNTHCVVINRQALLSVSGMRSELKYPELAVSALIIELQQQFKKSRITISSGLYVSVSSAPEIQPWMNMHFHQGQMLSALMKTEYPLYYQQLKLAWLDQSQRSGALSLLVHLLLRQLYRNRSWLIKLTQLEKMPAFGQWWVHRLLSLLALSAGTRDAETATPETSDQVPMRS